MKNLLFILLCCAAYSSAVCQPLPDSIKIKYNSAKSDAEKGKILFSYFDFLTTDNNIVLNKLNELNDYFIKMNDNVGQDHVQANLSFEKAIRGDYVDALEQSLKVFSSFERRKDKYGMMVTNLNIGAILSYSKDFELAIHYAKTTLPTALEYKDTLTLLYLYNDIATSYKELGKPDLGLEYALQSVKYAKTTNNTNSQIYPLSTLAECYIGLKQYSKAIHYLKESLTYANYNNRKFAICWSYIDFTKMYYEMDKQDSVKYYAYKTVDLATSIDFKDTKMKGYEFLYKSYEKTKKKDSAYKYLKLFVQEKEGLLNIEKSKKVQSINFKNQLRLQEVEQEKIQLKNNIRTYGLLTGLGILSIIGFMLYRNNRQKQKAYKILQEQKDKIQNTLSQLKSTQAQLIQSEKLASLGELTAGIAHEIQNPLNFVNNFSELSVDLTKELKEEIGKVEIPEKDKDYIGEILTDLSQNQEKINHHGKRASSIVKGMLEHSRASTGVKELTDINKLADEYLRLAYHGLRAKDNTFNADYKLIIDENLPKIEVIPQDIGRVLLNLINNAFYAVNQRKLFSNDESYTPSVLVSTEQVDNQIIVKVKDNGAGMPESVRTKVFQPFFTTKPTGQGTGLGLSLAYDIITKGHGGTLEVVSNEGGGSEFIISLPFKTN